MRSNSLTLAAVMAVAALLTGCTAAEKKLGRGFNNLTEPVRMGELQRSYEQATLFEGSGSGAFGIVRGVNRTVGRTMTGAFEVLTFPIPSEPYVMPDKLVHTDSFTPRHSTDTIMGTDTKLGFSSTGDVFPWAPGSRFSIFE
jgi:putative exosortase-associated protein (TIGR04073 family)